MARLTLRQFDAAVRVRASIGEAERAREGDSNDAEIEALWTVVDDVQTFLGMFEDEGI